MLKEGKIDLSSGKDKIEIAGDQPGMIYVAIGIIGATVMPHNLYLHSALVQSRRFQKDTSSIRSAVRFNTIDSVVALSVAFCVNAAILVLAATVSRSSKRNDALFTGWADALDAGAESHVAPQAQRLPAGAFGKHQRQHAKDEGERCHENRAQTLSGRGHRCRTRWSCRRRPARRSPTTR